MLEEELSYMSVACAFTSVNLFHKIYKTKSGNIYKCMMKHLYHSLKGMEIRTIYFKHTIGMMHFSHTLTLAMS